MYFSATEYDDRKVTGWTVNWGDGSTTVSLPSDAASAVHTYNAIGSETITVTATDADGSYPTTMAVQSVVAPGSVTASVSPSTINLGQVITLKATAPGSPVTYYWDLSGTGTYEISSASASLHVTWSQIQAVLAAHNLPAVGTLSNVRVLVDYSANKTNTWLSSPASLTILDVAPTATFSGTNVIVNAAGTVSFASPSSLASAAVFSYAYDFYDTGSFVAGGASASVPAALLAKAGTRTIQGKISDQYGGSTTYSTTITVTNPGPVITVPSSGTPNAGVPFTLSGMSFTDAGFIQASQPLTGYQATINWGDNTSSTGTLTVVPGSQGAAPSVSVGGTHSYKPGVAYVIQVNVTDADGVTGSKTFGVVVAAPTVTVTLGATPTAVVGSPASLPTTTFTDSVFGETHTATINWGDGTATQSVPAINLQEPSRANSPGTVAGTHTYADSGLYTVTVTVNDADQGQGSNSFKMVVADVAPAVTPGPDLVVGYNIPAPLMATFSHPAFASGTYTPRYTASVDWGDGSAPSTANVTTSPGSQGVPTTGTIAVSPGHSYTTPGDHTITITVIDDAGTVGTARLFAHYAPPAIAPGSPIRATLGSAATATTTFSAPGYVYTGSTPITATVDWGDGSTPTAATVTTILGSAGVATTGTIAASHLYQQPGNFTVTYQVNDGVHSATVTTTASVADTAPQVDPLPDQAIEPNTPFILTVNFHDAGRKTHTAAVDWGDGTITTVDDSSKFTDSSGVVHPGITEPSGSTPGQVYVGHVYTDDSGHTVTLTVYDNDGMSGQSSRDYSSVPVARITSVSSPNVVGTAITATGTSSDPSATFSWSASLAGQVVASQAGAALTSFTFTPATSGVYTISLQVADAQGQSYPATTSVTVAPINQAPSFVSGGDVAVLEDSGAHSLAWATGINPGGFGPGGPSVTAAFVVVGDSNSSLFGVAPAISASGVLSFTPAIDTYGSANISVQLVNTGGTANGGVDRSTVISFSINVGFVNQAPRFGLSSTSLTVHDNAGAQVVTGFVTGLSAGPPNQSGETVKLSIDPSYNAALFASAPSIGQDGTLRFAPAVNAQGTTTVTIRATNNGGTANGGHDTTAESFTIAVQDVTTPVVVDLIADFGTQSMSILNVTRDLPWFNLKALDVIFSEPVTLGAAAVSLTGKNVAVYHPTLTVNGNDAHLSLPTAPDIDKLMLTLDGSSLLSGARDLNGNLMGGTFGKAISILPGDYLGNGQVTIASPMDILILAGSGTYSAWADVDGSGVVNVQDYNQVRQRVGTKLPN